MSRNEKNICQKKDGRWEGRYIKGREGGKSRYGYVFGRTYDEAEKNLLACIMSQSMVNADCASFAIISRLWLECSKPQLKPGSIAKYTNTLNSYLLPVFGGRQIEEISRGDIQEFGNELLISGGIKASGLAPKTVNSILSVAKNVFKYASDEKGLRVVDIKSISVKQPQKPLRVLSLHEQKKFSAYLRENLSPCNLGILLCLYTGLRIGEICALKWMDIYFTEQYLYVHQAMQRIQLLDGSEKKTEVRVSEPKSNCSIRRIPIPDEMLLLLSSSRKTDDAFILTGMVQRFIEPRCMENHFKAAVEACELKGVNFHALRHTFATRCVELGFDIKSLSEILGHSSVNITLNRYVHPSMELKQKNMNMLSDLLATD